MQLRLAIVLCVMGATPSVVFAQAPAAAASNNASATTPTEKWAPEDCADGVDNDGDGAADCADKDCRGYLTCRPEHCSNGRDDDDDGKVDCADDECSSKPICQEAGHCLDGKDNDGDGLIDCSDDDCNAVAECDAAKDAFKAAKAAEIERALRPYKVQAALKALAQAQKDEASARKDLVDDPSDASARTKLGTAIGEQLTIRQQLGGWGWAPAPAPAVARPATPPSPSAPASTASAPAAPSAPASAALRRVNFTGP